MKTKTLLILKLLLLVAFSNKGFAQIHSYESTGGRPAPTVISVDSYNSVEYDKCTGVLNFGVEATKSGSSGTWLIMKMFVYIKVGNDWKLMTTIRGVDAGLGGATYANTGTGSPNGYNGSNITASTWSPPQFSPVGQNTFDGDNSSNDKRISYASGAYNNFYWATWEDHNICQTYNSVATLTNAAAPMYMLANNNPPRIYTSHSTQIAQNLTPISFYPSNGSEWGIQFGVANIPAEAINGNVINVRVYKHTRSMCCLTSTAIVNNGYQVLEFATNVNSIDAPFGLSASTNQCNQVTLNWQNPTQTWSSSYNCTNTQSYKNIVYRDGNKIAVVDGDLSQYIDNDVTLAQRQTYNYTVKKLLWNKDLQTYRLSSSSNVAVGNMLMPPAQASPFTASNNKCNSSIELSWGQPSGTAASNYTL